MSLLAVSRVSPSGLVVQFGNRDRMLEVSATLLGRARIDGILRRRRAGVHALLPESADDLVDTRVWLGLCELGRGRPGVALRGGLRHSPARTCVLSSRRPSQPRGWSSTTVFTILSAKVWRFLSHSGQR